MGGAIRLILAGQYGMALLGCGFRYVQPWFLAFQPHQQNLPGSHAVQRQAGANEGHRASLGGYVEFPVGWLFLLVHEFHHWLFKNKLHR